jgi:hypothetical protein
VHQAIIKRGPGRPRKNFKSVNKQPIPTPEPKPCEVCGALVVVDSFTIYVHTGRLKMRLSQKQTKGIYHETCAREKIRMLNRSVSPLLEFYGDGT